MKSERTDTPPQMVKQEPTEDDVQLPFVKNDPTVPPIKLEPKESSTSSLQSQSPKLKRSTSSGQDDSQLLRTPSKSAKHGLAGTPKTPRTPAQSQEAFAKKLASTKKKTEESAINDVAAADAKKAEAQEQKAARGSARQWKTNWKDCVESHQTNDRFSREDIGQSMNVKNAKAFFELKPNELSSLPNWPTVNSNNPGFAPSWNCSWAACGELAFRKEAMLAGIDEEDEDFLDKGKKLFRISMLRGMYPSPRCLR
jgi:hypothetical protein